MLAWPAWIQFSSSRCIHNMVSAGTTCYSRINYQFRDLWTCVDVEIQTYLHTHLKCIAIELSSNSTWLLVGSWLSCIHNLSCSVNLWWLLGGSVEVRIENILHRFLEVQTYFGMPRGALHSNTNTSSEYAPQVERNYLICIQNNLWIIIGYQLLKKSPIDLKDYPNFLKM